MAAHTAVWSPITYIAGAAAKAAHTRSAADNAGAGLARGFCTVYIDCIRFALGDVRRAERDIRKALRSHGGNERVAVRALHFYGVTRAAGAADADRVLFGIRCGGLQHAGAACAEHNAAIDGKHAVAVKCAVTVTGGAADVHRTAVNRKRTVGIEPVAGGVYDERAAVDGERICTRGAEAAVNGTACGIQTVVACGDINRTAVDGEVDGFKALSGLFHHDGAVLDRKGVICVQAVVAGLYGDTAA